MNRATKMIVIFIFSYLTTLLLCIDINLDGFVFGEINKLTQVKQLITNFDVIDLIMGIIIYFFYYQVFFNNEKLTKKNIIIGVLSVVLSTFIVIGKNLQIVGNFPDLSNIILFFETIIVFLGSYLAFYAILKKIISLDVFSDDSSKKYVKKNKKIKIKSKKSLFSKIKLFCGKIASFIREHPFISSFIIIMLVRIPFVVIFYPGNSNGDTFDQLCQFFHRDASWSKDMVNLVDKNVYINQHHPVFSTFILGGAVKLGMMIHNFDFGLFLYVISQLIITSLIFSFVIYYMKKINIPFWIRNLVLAIICLVPHYLSYTLLAIKDTPNAIFTLLYLIFLIQIIRNYNSIYNNKRNLIFFVITILMVMLFRNNGILTIVMSYPFLFFLYKKHLKKLLVVFLIPIIIYFSFNEVMYRCFSFSKGSPKEILSIPFMQIARVANREGADKFSKKDQKTINKVLDFKKITKEYYPDLSDPVKDTYRNDTTKEELIDFFKVWFKYLCKYPRVYVESFINSTYSYFYPYEFYENLMLGSDDRVAKEFDSYESVYRFAGIKDNIGTLMQVLFRIPIIGILFRVAFYDWFLILSCVWVIYKKNYKYLIPLFALVSVLLVCLASPINGSMRYILPILFSLPAMVMVDYLVYIEDKKV